MRTVQPRPRLTNYLQGRLASIEATHADFVDIPYVLDGAERQLVECERLQIQGLEKLGTDVSTLTKLQSVLSELHVASIFARLGSKVTVLKD